MNRLSFIAGFLVCSGTLLWMMTAPGQWHGQLAGYAVGWCLMMAGLFTGRVTP